ncbi:MAG: DUF3649 domain-containing protein [Cellvibrionaceae bacterium]|nr:DUF3649 domain-containing protein [Cellvibrionaceae bacterium]
MPTFTDATLHRWLVASRVLAAAVGGYALTSAATVLLALIWPVPQAQAIVFAALMSFVLYAGVIIWVFAVKHLRTVWLGLTAATVLCSGLAWLLLPGGAP